MAIEIKIVDPTAEQLAKLLSIFYPEPVFGYKVPPPIGADNPAIGAPNEVDAAQAFGGVNTDKPAADVFAPAGPSPEAAFAGNASAPTAPIAPAAVGSPVPPAPAPGASAPPAASNPGGVDLDSRGLPWDARIHAKAAGGGGSKNADGSWRAKRGLNDAALVARIEGELRQVLAAPGPVGGQQPQGGLVVAPPAILPVPPLPTVPPAPPAPNAPGAPVLSAGTGAPVPPAPVVVGGTQPTSNYVELVQQIAAAMGAGKLAPAEVQAACLEFGVPDLPLLATRPDLVTSVSSRINALLASKG